jgi:PknH-like extracellular domain
MRHLVMVLALASAGALTSGCTATVNGNPQPAANAADIVGVGRPIAQVLPTDAELSGALGTAVSSIGLPPMVGGLDALPDGIRDGTQASEIQCLGVIAPFMQKVFEDAPVRATATQRFDNWSDWWTAGPSYSVTVGAIALAAPSDARGLFSKFAEQWQQCQGKTMVLFHPASSPGDHLQEIIDVHTTDTTISAVVMDSDSETHNAPSPAQRALAVVSNCIVGVKLSDSRWLKGDPVSSDLAVRVANLMAAKVGAST